MPASASLVTLDHAKDWAKRLKASSSAFATLSEAQKAVATMLGHASWHALIAFYGRQSSFQEVPSKHPALDSESPFPGVLSLINSRFPGIDAVEVEVLACETDEIETDADTLVDRIADLDGEGYFPETAIQAALKEMTQTVYAPPGFMMVRVRGSSGKAFQVLVGVKDYQQAQGVG